MHATDVRLTDMIASDVVLEIGGEDWRETPGVISVPLNSDRLALHARRGSLKILTSDNNWANVRAVLWRAQFDLDFTKEHELLSMIKYSDTPCINTVDCMIHYGSRLSGLTALANFGLPILDGSYFLGRRGLSYEPAPCLPAVLKIGNWHQGFGKARAMSPDVWADMVDLAVTSDRVMAVEPFLKISRDIRYLSVFGTKISIERRSANWKSNVDPNFVRVIEPPKEIVEPSEIAIDKMGADVAGLDWIQAEDGNWFILEVNLAPGIYRPGFYDYRAKIFNALDGR